MKFIKELQESRMIRDENNARTLTYTDAKERTYLTLLILEILGNNPRFRLEAKEYARKSRSADQYQSFKIDASDLHNFLYFIVGPSAAQDKLKDPAAAKRLKQTTTLPLYKLSEYLKSLQENTKYSLTSALFIKLEQGLQINNTAYKNIRRVILNWNKSSSRDKKTATTDLLFAARAKLRSSDIISSFEAWSAAYDMEDTQANDNEPSVSVPDISTSTGNLALYRYLVGGKNLMLTKKFLELALANKTIPAPVVQAYLPAIKSVDDIVQGGPSFVQQLRLLRSRAIKSKK
jgi:hypothetical protein